MSDTLNDLRVLLFRRGLRQIEVVPKLEGISNSRLSAIFNEREPMPDGFEAAFRSAVDEVAAEKAARLLGEVKEEAAA